MKTTALRPTCGRRALFGVCCAAQRPRSRRLPRSKSKSEERLFGQGAGSADRAALPTAPPEPAAVANGLSATRRGPDAGVTWSAIAQPCARALPLSRRGMAVMLASSVVYGGLPSLLGPAQAARPPPPKPLPPCNGPLDGQLAAALTRAVYSSVVELRVMDEEDFQRENFKLREREYRYYAAANRTQLPLVPDLADNTGGLSNPAYFNFIHYCLWKVVYRHVTAPEAREAFALAASAAFLSLAQVDQQLEARIEKNNGGGAAAATTAAATTGAAAAVPEVIGAVVLPFLELLRSGGYICGYQLVLGSHPGNWPQDWMVSQPVVLTEDEEQVGAEAQEGGGWDRADGRARTAVENDEFLFQLKLHRPADILGSVALRSEEGGAWPHTVSSCLQLLLERRAGYRSGLAAAVGPGLGAEPADRQQQQPEAMAGSGASKGPRVAECDEFFYQDQWQGPSSLADKLLLFFGDPLEKVGVDFVPTTLVQNWRLRG